MAELKESFWGDMYGRTRLFWQEFLQEEPAKERDRYLGLKEYERAYLSVDAVSLLVRHPSGRQRVQMLLARGVKRECPWS
jgi:hypothetical protein